MAKIAEAENTNKINLIGEVLTDDGVSLVVKTKRLLKCNQSEYIFK